MGIWDTSDREFQKEGEQVALTKTTRMAAEDNFQEAPLQTGLFNAESGVGVCTRWVEALGTWDRSWVQGTSLGVVNRQEVKTGCDQRRVSQRGGRQQQQSVEQEGLPKAKHPASGGGQAVVRAAAPVPAGRLPQKGGRASEVTAGDGVGGPRWAQVQGERRHWEQELVAKAVPGKRGTKCCSLL